jgi:hypothetical protein
MCTSIWQGGLTNCEKTHGVEPFNTANYSRFKRLPNPLRVTSGTDDQERCVMRFEFGVKWGVV